MTYSLVGQAQGSAKALSKAAHYELLRIIRDFACGSLILESYSGTGNGAIKMLANYGGQNVEETWTITCTATATNGGTFSVVGSTTGSTASATVGTAYDNGYIQFLIQDGSVDFATSDAFVLSTSNGVRTLYDESYSGTGNGEIIDMVLLDKVTETWTLVCTSAATNGGTFSVTGSTSGAQASATVGTAYDNGIIKFLIEDGTVDFAVNDTFTLKAIAQELPTAERWTPHKYDDTGNDHELYIEGPGRTGIGTVFCQFKTVQSVGSDYYNLAYSTSQGYVSSNTWETQPNIDEKSVLMWQFNIPYWLRISQRQIQFIADIETRYEYAYAGLYNCYLTPDQYPYPCCQLGSADGKSTSRYSTTHNNGTKRNGSNGSILWIDGSFKTPLRTPTENTYYSDSTDPVVPTHDYTVQYTGTGNGTFTRYFADDDAPKETWTITATSATTFTVVGSISGAQTNATVGTLYTSDGGEITFLLTAGGTAFVASDVFTFQIRGTYIMEKHAMYVTSEGMYGELEGLHWISGFSNAVENTVNDGTNTHIVGRDVSGTGLNDYFTMILD